MEHQQDFYKLLFLIFLLCIDTGLSIIHDEDYSALRPDVIISAPFSHCPPEPLKNGYVFLTDNSTVAEFSCRSGFTLYGDESSDCEEGEWDPPFPLCVARGCPRVPSVSNGRITEMYNGAVLFYDCNPGYVRVGNRTIHCDGSSWDSSPPLCAIATEKPETYCDFEHDLCGWSRDPTAEFDWRPYQASRHTGASPVFDHTLGENKSGYYLYIKAKYPSRINDTARLFSPVYPQDFSGGCFIFWYNIYWKKTGGIRVYIKPESHAFDELKPNWEKYGDHGGEQWLKGHMVVPVLHENFQIVIEGVPDGSHVGDSSIDDVRLKSKLCDTDDNSTDVTERNSTVAKNTDEPLPEDFTTSSFLTPQSPTTSKFPHSEEPFFSTTLLQTVKQESITGTISDSSSTVTAASVPVYLNNSTADKILPTIEQNIETSSSKSSTNKETAGLSDIAISAMLKTEASTSATNIKTTKFFSSDIPATISKTVPTTTTLLKTLTLNTQTEPTESAPTKQSDFYESKFKTNSSSSNIPTVVYIVIFLIICIIVGTAYYMRKERSKRQSKLSNDSVMRFLPESDNMEYSDSSALDRILTK